MAFCANCGLKLMDGAKFCPVCGTRTPLAEGSAASRPAAAAPSPTIESKAPKKQSVSKRQARKTAPKLADMPDDTAAILAVNTEEVAAPVTAPMETVAKAPTPTEDLQSTSPVLPTAAPRKAAAVSPRAADIPAASKSKRKTRAATMRELLLEEEAPADEPAAQPAVSPVSAAKRHAPSIACQDYIPDDENDSDDDALDLFEDIDPVPDGNVHDLSVGARAVLAYGNVFFLIPLLTAKDSRYARFHAIQGFNLFLLEVAGSLLVWLIGILLSALLDNGLIGILLSALLPAVFGLFCGILAIMGVVHACRGQMKRLPVVGRLRILK